MVESQWRALYKAVLFEFDPKQLQTRVQAAMDAIHARANDAGVPRDERIAMEEALLTLEEVVTLRLGDGEALAVRTLKIGEVDG
jgi:hypothetical protein